MEADRSVAGVRGYLFMMRRGLFIFILEQCPTSWSSVWIAVGRSYQKEATKKKRGWVTKHFHRPRVGQMKAKALHVSQRLFLVVEEKVVGKAAYFSYFSIGKEWGRNKQPAEMESCRKFVIWR
ncbi:hypothetical protein AVEN_211669-1 [Araneus ventricosus]|uniref:Uncharacterized protein n=1 Tax=Araneus ventricosus TaxID=182803 RepID=A0A4Y2L263_ARAVE|nr:hypothetical protein AVEN_211669-1 [Araneus ventricosus]